MERTAANHGREKRVEVEIIHALERDLAFQERQRGGNVKKSTREE